MEVEMKSERYSILEAASIHHGRTSKSVIAEGSGQLTYKLVRCFKQLKTQYFRALEHHR